MSQISDPEGSRQIFFWGMLMLVFALVFFLAPLLWPHGIF